MVSGVPVSPTAADLVANAPSMGGPFVTFLFTATPQGGGKRVQTTCPISTCSMKGLEPGAKYDVHVIASSDTGATTPPSAAAYMAMPALAAPTLLTADASGPTQGIATGVAPTSGGPWSSYTFTASRLDSSGSQLVAASATPTVTLNGLAPSSQYSVVVVANGSNGPSPKSNRLIISTPSLKYAEPCSLTFHYII